MCEAEDCQPVLKALRLDKFGKSSASSLSLTERERHIKRGCAYSLVSLFQRKSQKFRSSERLESIRPWCLHPIRANLR